MLIEAVTIFTKRINCWWLYQKKAEKPFFVHQENLFHQWDDWKENIKKHFWNTTWPISKKWHSFYSMQLLENLLNFCKTFAPTHKYRRSFIRPFFSNANLLYFVCVTILWIDVRSKIRTELLCLWMWKVILKITFIYLDFAKNREKALFRGHFLRLHNGISITKSEIFVFVSFELDWGPFEHLFTSAEGCGGWMKWSELWEWP